MTKDEAIKILEEYRSMLEGFMDHDEPAFTMAIESLSADNEVSDYAKWLENIIVKAETLEWLCEDATDEEWCENNCHYSSIQAECLRHLYEVSKGGDTE